MTDELKPVNCGCGGTPVVGFTGVWCNKCGIITERYNNIEDAIRAWNLALSRKTAKVEVHLHPCGVSGICGACGSKVYNEDPYCSSCGAKLEWE